MQRRIALFALTAFGISLGLFVVSFAVYAGALGIPAKTLLGSVQTRAHLAGSIVMGLTWGALSWRAWSAPARRAFEVGALVLSTTAWAFLLDFAQPRTFAAVLLAISFTAITRAIIVPSTAQRTLALTALAFVPVFPVAIAGAPAGTAGATLVVDAALWAASAVAVATVASHVIYGLRRQVAAARDVGSYTLEQKLGSGGMGEVWRANHRMLIRPAAIKIVNAVALGSAPGGPDVLLRRFEREARATAALRSPHTVQLYDFGVSDDGRLYYAMELLEGLDLETLVRRFGPVPAERAIHIAIQVCQSLAEAHRAGLVHRDIKPANLFVQRHGADRDFVKVLDFGLVKLGDKRGAGHDALDLTASGTITGTPAYMAPEFVLGHGEDHRADLYALGCVLYYLLTGETVFSGDTPMQMMFDHVQATPVPPSQRTTQPVPAALEQLILALLAKDPAQRPQSATELREQLARIEVAKQWTTQRADRWWQLYLPEPSEPRPIADVLRSRETRRATSEAVGRTTADERPPRFADLEVVDRALPADVRALMWSVDDEPAPR
jgi:serine/threonine-protein kinase